MIKLHRFWDLQFVSMVASAVFGWSLHATEPTMGALLFWFSGANFGLWFVDYGRFVKVMMQMRDTINKQSEINRQLLDELKRKDAREV